jgi:DNA polymerase III sliding clamp (beta) subunit (PCNA family)
MSESVTELQFTAVSKSSEIWKSVSSVIMTIVDEASFEAGSTGLTFRSMDPSHVALVDLSWPNSAFEKYECPSTIKFGLRMSDFAKIIKRSNSNDSIEIGLKGNSLNIKTTGGYSSGLRISCFYLHYLNIFYNGCGDKIKTLVDSIRCILCNP